jgi:hypothetical protein
MEKKNPHCFCLRRTWSGGVGVGSVVRGKGGVGGLERGAASSVGGDGVAWMIPHLFASSLLTFTVPDTPSLREI